MPDTDLVVIATYTYTGWVTDDIGTYYVIDDAEQLTGWTEIDGAWYYLDPTTGYRAEDVTRVPYPTVKINGITYEPDQEAIDYANAHGKTFIDETEAWFFFNADGQFAYYSFGTITYSEDDAFNRKLTNGMVAWHPGLVQIPGADFYMYFIGDEVNGGNMPANGDTYLTRTNDIEGFNKGDIYHFQGGKFSGRDGIVTEDDGVKKYYEDSKLMVGNGLTKVDGNYIYVRSNGELVVGTEYWVPANSFGIEEGMYVFDANGYLVIPEADPVKDGVYYENGGWFLYENGVKGYNKGLITVTENWIDGDETESKTGTIYVRSNGQLATGEYYVTNLANYTGSDVKAGDKVEFSDDGIMNTMKNGIINGSYYINNQIAYGAGLIQIDGDYYYVKSDGQIVVGTTYWITNVNDTGVTAKAYTFDATGVMQNPEYAADAKNGIVDGFYYENGHIQYNAGLIEYNGKIIYVRSNGMVATGEYWVTNSNGLREQGLYNFGTDGYLIEA